MLKQINNYSFIIPVILTAISLSLIISIPSAAAYANYLSDKKLSPIYEVNTRIKEIPFSSYAAVNFTLTKLVQTVPMKLPFIFMVIIETIQKPKKNLIDYKHH